MNSLYQRLGGAEGISRLVDDVVEAHLSNPVIKARFLPYLERPEYVEQIKKHTRDFFGAGSGGPEVYSGRSMVDSHRGMNISEAEFMAAVDDILGVLTRHDMDPQTHGEVLSILYSMKSEIMHV